MLELNGSIGILAMTVLLTNMDDVKGWVMRIAVSVALKTTWYSGRIERKLT